MKHRYTVGLVIGMGLFFYGWGYKRYDNDSYIMGVSCIAVALIIISACIYKIFKG